ncbi:DUF305 domain-containing protein [Sphingomonas sp. RHCKR7]|nr:DUF305 domain-containing protein [Sphingomonas folli]
MATQPTGDPDTDFLAAMIAHHEGAVDMARKEIANGSDPRIRQMAENVIRVQQAEIVQMRRWLTERSAATQGGK